MSALYQLLVMGSAAIVVIYLWKVVIAKFPQLFPGWRNIVAGV